MCSEHYLLNLKKIDYQIANNYILQNCKMADTYVSFCKVLYVVNNNLPLVINKRKQFDLFTSRQKSHGLIMIIRPRYKLKQYLKSISHSLPTILLINLFIYLLYILVGTPFWRRMCKLPFRLKWNLTHQYRFNLQFKMQETLAHLLLEYRLR